MLRACESFDSAVFRCESNQGLTNSENVENRIDSQTLRSSRSERLKARGAPRRGRVKRRPTGPTTRNIRSPGNRSDEHTTEHPSIIRISYADLCLQKQKT